jgi:uracil-DNA glycosylase
MQNLVSNEWIELFSRIGVIEKIDDLIKEAYSKEDTLPPLEKIFTLFNSIEPTKVKVIIIGQDPYHTPGVANGIAFSSDQTKTPPSLKNIYKELKNDLGVERTTNSLIDWVEQGVFLINPIWTVKKGEPNSHKSLGWQEISCKIIDELLKMNPKIIFCLWGNGAKYLYNNLVFKSENVISSAHPSPFSYYRGFENSKPFSKINKIISEQSLGNEIKW